MSSPFPTLAGWHDVFLEILNFLEPMDDSDGEDEGEEIYFGSYRCFQNTLLSLALLCRAFLDPSLSKLWHDLDDIHPLLKLLPNYQRGHDSRYNITGDILPEAWARLQTYAARVRDVGVSRADGFDPAVWPIVLKQCQGRPLCPNARGVRIGMWYTSHDSLGPVQALASPSLRSVFISINADRNADRGTFTAVAEMVLQKFTMQSPGLTRLSFHPYQTLGCEHLASLSRFVQMEQLRLNDRSILNEDLLAMLAGLRNLTHLAVSVVLSRPSEADTLDFRDGFQKLVKLELELHCRPGHLPRFFLATSMPHLRDLTLRLRNHPADGFLTSFPSICRHIGPHTLTRLRDELGDFARPPRFLMDLLEPLLQFGELEALEVVFEEHLPLRDSDIDRFARTWPRLRLLLLLQSDATVSDTEREPGAVERPTLDGLIALARGCPHLDCLCLPDLDVRVLPPVGRVPLLAHGPLDLCIQNLVGAEDGEQQLDIAVALDRLFPLLKLELGIEGFEGYGENPSPFLEDSESVSRLLRAMQLARKNYPCGV